MIQVREFTTAAEVFANAAAVRARLFNVRPKPRHIVVDPKPVEKTAAPRRNPNPRVLPMWYTQPMLFDEHVIAYRVRLAVQSIQAEEDETPCDQSRRTVRDIVLDVLKDYPEFTIADLKSARRPDKLTKVRHLAVYEVRRNRPDMSLPAIGRWFGGRDHSTIHHSIMKIKAIRGEFSAGTCY